MLDNLIDSLWITLIGMGLVFLGIVFLWGLMSLMMYIFRPKAKAAKPEEQAEIVMEGSDEPEEAVPATNLKVQAAAAAVVAALAMRATSSQTAAGASPLLPSAGVTTVSPWQAVLRSGQFHLNAQIYMRKPRG